MNNNTGMSIPTNTSWSRKAKAVRCIETGVIYKSANEAAKEIGSHGTSITRVCLGKCKTAKGKHFCFVGSESETSVVNETEKEIAVSHKAIIKGKGSCTNGNTNAVLCITDGSIYTSCTDAANANDVAVGQMSHTCRTKGSHAKGKQYCYIKDIDMHIDSISDAINKKNLYNALLAKENRRKQLRNMIADYKGDIKRLEQELTETYAKLSNAEQELINMD